MKKLIFILLILNASLVRSEDEVSDITYVRLTKGMVLNYGDPSLTRLRYLKVDVQVRVLTPDDADVIEHHMPALQDALVMLFSAQDADTVRSIEGKENIRAMALSETQKVIEKEEGLPLIEDLLFTTFIVQR